ncbi:DnaJ C-terminal domain-containing protein [Shigella flexneri]
MYVGSGSTAPIFEREGNNLSCEVPITSLWRHWVARSKYRPLDGHVELKVPGETPTGGCSRMRGKGVSLSRGGTPGDYPVPRCRGRPRLNGKQKQLLQELQESSVAIVDA